MKRTALYRHFDADGVLLYVGISLSAINRLGQHKENAHWFDSIARVDVEWLTSRGEALTAEAIAIAREGPLWNKSRPRVEFFDRKPPIPSETNEVRCRGQALDPVIWQGKQWAVTEYGIEARDGTYAIQTSRLRESEPGYSWKKHLAEKLWVDLADFERAFAIACWVHRGEPCCLPKAKTE